MKVLFVNACIRNKESRTLRLAKAFIDKLEKKEPKAIISETKLYEENLKPLLNSDIKKRDGFVSKKDFSDQMFRWAKEFKENDVVIIATPFWDLSFPSLLKFYIENIFVNELTFKYENGIPMGLSKVKKVVLIATSGGPINENNLNYLFDAMDFLSSDKTKRIKSFVSMVDVLPMNLVDESIRKEIQRYDTLIDELD